jgi:hypothetical protein
MNEKKSEAQVKSELIVASVIRDSINRVYQHARITNSDHRDWVKFYLDHYHLRLKEINHTHEQNEVVAS